MCGVRTSPGPAADRAFRLGMVACVVLGLAAVGTLYWTGTTGLLMTGYTLVFLFPVYLVVAATALSVWLGYDKGTASLRPVTRDSERRRN